MKATSINRQHAGWFPVFVAIAAYLAVPCAWSQGTALTYQGQLDDGASPANGSYDLQFRIWDSSIGGSPISGTINYVSLPVTNGLFTVELDFGTGAFTGPNRWLEIGVQTNGGGGYTTLAPRTKITSAPYAVRAQSAASVPAGSVGSVEVADESLTSSDLGPNSVGSSEVINNSLTAADLAADSVGASEIATGAVGTSEVADGSLTTADLNLASVDARYVNVAGDEMTGTLSIFSLTTPLRLRATSNPMMELYGGTARKAWIQAYNNDLYLANEMAGNLRLRTSGSDQMVIDSTGRVGIGGIANPATTLDVYGTAYLGAHSDGIVNIGISSGPHITYDADDIQAMYSTNTANLWLNYYGGNVYIGRQGSVYLGNSYVQVQEDGDVGIGRSPATYGFEVQGDVGLYDSDVNLYASDGSHSVQINGDTAGGVYLYNTDGDLRQYTYAGSYGYSYYYNSAGSSRLYLSGDSYDGGYVSLYSATGVNTVRLYGDYAGTGNGRVITSELQITGGSDLSEQFNVADSGHGVQPGMLVCIDPANPGKLVVSTRAYDRTVAGIVSGAGGVRPGMMMGQNGTVANGEHAVALTGRVYCFADASSAPIEPGDLITTSDVPGHGMKVTDHAMAQGAIIGKAMTTLSEGRGLILVLVSLQ